MLLSKESYIILLYLEYMYFLYITSSIIMILLLFIFIYYYYGFCLFVCLLLVFDRDELFFLFLGEFTTSIMKVWYPECLVVILISYNDFRIDVMKWNNSFRFHLVNIIINLEHPYLKIKSICLRSMLANKELSRIAGLDFQSAATLSCCSCHIKDLEA